MATEEAEAIYVTYSDTSNSPTNTSTLVPSRLLSDTAARRHEREALEASKTQIKDEEDPWWEKRGNKCDGVGLSLTKKYEGIGSKLTAPTTASTSASRPKAITGKEKAKLEEEERKRELERRQSSLKSLAPVPCSSSLLKPTMSSASSPIPPPQILPLKSTVNLQHRLYHLPPP